MSVQAGVVDLADSALNANNVLTDAAIQAISHLAKFGAVRCETIYLGFFKHGDVLPVVASPVDGYQYVPGTVDGTDTVLYDFDLFCSRAPGPGFFSGMPNVPPISFSQPGNIFWFTHDVDASRTVQLATAYADGTGFSHDGILKVDMIGQRSATLTFAAIPAYVDIPLDVFAVGQPLRTGSAGAYGLLDILHNAKFGCVRKEVISRGYWSMGYTVPPPVSPVDGYQYGVTEVINRGIVYSNLARAGSFANGQATAPTLAGGQLQRDGAGKGPLYWWTMNIDRFGNTSGAVSYYVQGGAETIRVNSGIMKVFSVCQRGSVNT